MKSGRPPGKPSQDIGRNSRMVSEARSPMALASMVQAMASNPSGWVICSWTISHRLPSHGTSAYRRPSFTVFINLC